MPDEGRQTPLPPSLIARLALRGALRNLRRLARHLVRAAAAAQATGAAGGQGAAVRLSVRRQSLLCPARDRRRLVRRAQGARRRAAAAARRHRDAQGPGRGAELFGARTRSGGRRRRRRTAKAALAFLVRPDRRHAFSAWLRMLLEDMLVIDAATLYPRFARDGALYSLDVIDGATITPLIGEDGRSPDPPDPAYQQILHGVPAADFSSDELLYLPRNLRAPQALRLLAGRTDRAHHQHRAVGAKRRRSTITAPARPPTPSPRCRRNGRSTRSASSRIISTR